MSKLAIYGGEPAITIPQPHFEWPIIGEKEIEAVAIQMRTGELSMYGHSGIVKEFETNFREYHNVEYAVSTNSGTTALHSAFFGCGIGPGDEVLAPTYTFLATVTPIFHVNAIPVLCDARKDNGNILPSHIEERITGRTKAIVVTHMWGHPVDIDEIIEICRGHNLFLIEDCSHAHGATYKGRKVGTFGDVSCFSLQANKIVCAGEGGILLTNNQEIYERATLLGHYRKRSEECVESEFYRQFVKTGYGLKYRIHPLGAVIANVQFQDLEERIEMRRENLEYFSEGLKDIACIEPPYTELFVTRGAWYGFKPLVKLEALGKVSLERYIEALQSEGMDVHKPGSKPLHLLPLFQRTHDGMYDYDCPRRCPFAKRQYVYKEGDFPGSEFYYSRALSLPTFTLPSKHIIDQYLDAFTKVADNIKELL